MLDQPGILLQPAAALAASLGLSLVLTPVVRRIARRYGFVNRPAADRWAKEPTALLGGVALVVAAVVGCGLAILLTGSAGAVATHMPAAQPALGVLFAAALMFAVGLADDITNLTPSVKFIFQALAGVVLVSMGAVIHLTGLYWINALVTIFWFVAITNAMNLLDNMDGVSAGVAAIAALFLGLACLRGGAWLAATMAWAVTGAAIGFLRYNFSPASIFMGDAGSLFIGAMLAGLAAASPAETSGSLLSVLFVPLVIVAVPIIDTTLVTVTRAIAGRSFTQGGRDHTTHRLVALGLSERQVAGLLYAFATVGGVVAMWLTRLDMVAGLALGAAFLATLALIAAYLGHLHVEYTNEPRGSKTMTVIMTQLVFKRRLAEIMLDALLLGVAWVAAFRLRFDELPPVAYMTAFEQTLAVALGVQLVCLALFGVYKGAWRYVGVVDMYRIAGALLVATIVMVGYAEWRVPELARSHSIIYINTLCAAALTLTARLSWRSLHLLRHALHLDGEPVIVYGAGDAGDMALREMMNNPSLGYVPACLLDDDVRKHGARIHGVRVMGGIESVAAALERHRSRTIVITVAKLREDVRTALHALAEREGTRLIALDLRFRNIDVDDNGSAVPLPARASSPRQRLAVGERVTRRTPSGIHGASLP